MAVGGRGAGTSGSGGSRRAAIAAVQAAQARQALIARSAAMQKAGYGKAKPQRPAPVRKATRPSAPYLPKDYGVAPHPALRPSDVQTLAALPHTHFVPTLRTLDRLLGSPVGSGIDLVEHPHAHLFPQPRRDAAGNLLPLSQQPESTGIVPFTPGGIPGVGAIGRGLARAKGAFKGEALAGAAAKDLPKTPRQVVSGSLRGAKSVRGKQEAGYSAERSRRATEINRIMQENPGIAGHHQALAALRGELPKINFGGFKQLTPDALDALAKHIHEHPHLMPFQKITAVRALENAAEGKVPTNSEIKLLTNIFGKDTTAGLTKVHTLPDHIKNAIIETLNVPRSLMASFDLSAPFRQGLMAGARHPVIFARNFGPMIRSFAKEGAYQQIEAEIRSRPTFHMMDAAKLAITDLEPSLTNREENLFGYGMAEKIPVVGHGVRASGRAYNAFLTKMRADVFDHLVKGFEQQGINVQDEEFLKALGRYINASTGRGDLGHFQQAAPYLNTVFFSPRLLASRLNFLNPVFYARLPAPIRAEAIRSAVQLTGLVTTMLGVARFGGAKVGLDPRNADFAKIRVGNTRLDVLGGFQQPIRLLAQLESGKIISSTTGDPLTLGPGFGHVSRRDIIQRFAEGKLAPVPSVANDFLKGQNFQGQPFSWKTEAVQHVTPLLGQDAADLYHARGGGPRGIAAATAGYGVGAFGVGLQTYGPKDLTKTATSNGRKLRNEIIVGARNHGLLGKNEPLSAPVEQALRAQTRRLSSYAKAGVKSDIHGRVKAKDQGKAYLADVRLAISLGKLPKNFLASVAQPLANGTLKVDGKTLTPFQTKYEISRARDYLNKNYFGGNTISDVRGQIRAKARSGG